MVINELNKLVNLTILRIIKIKFLVRRRGFEPLTDLLHWVLSPAPLTARAPPLNNYI